MINFGKNTYWINARKSGVYTTMLKQMISQLEAMIEHHNKVHVIRFDLRQLTPTDNNERITTFNRRLFKWLKREYSLTRIGFNWCREQETAKQQHYHYVLMLDGNKIDRPAKVLSKVRSTRENMDGSYWLPKNCYYNLVRGEHKEIQKAVFRISYLAKARGKGYRPPQTKDYSTSRLKRPTN